MSQPPKGGLCQRKSLTDPRAVNVAMIAPRENFGKTVMEENLKGGICQIEVSKLNGEIARTSAMNALCWGGAEREMKTLF
jgi:hypothetical protein